MLSLLSCHSLSTQCTIIHFFCCKKIFLHRKHKKTFYAKIFLRCLFPCYTPALHILVYLLSQQVIFFSQAISSARGAISCPPHRTCKIIGLRKICEDENLLDEKKANYGTAQGIFHISSVVGLYNTILFSITSVITIVAIIGILLVRHCTQNTA